jgi:ABC-type Fe3+ transport system permease subunit
MRPDDPAVIGRQPAPGAVAALVWGIVGLTVLPLIGAVLALVYAGKARQAAEEQPYRFDYQLGRVGRILGWIGLAPMAVVAVVVLVGLAARVASG